jgi:hypothetical protein
VAIGPATAAERSSASPATEELAPEFFVGAFGERALSNPACLPPPSLYVSIGLAAVDAHDRPFSSTPGYDQRLRVDMGTRTKLVPHLHWSSQWRSWSFQVGIEREQLLDTRWDLFALPLGYQVEPLSADFSDDDWYACVSEVRATFGGSRRINSTLRLGVAALLERWSVDLGQVISSPTDLSAPLAQLYGEAEGSGSGWSVGAIAGITLQARDNLLIAAQLQWRPEVRFDGQGRVTTWIPSALQWSEGLKPLEHSSGPQKFYLNDPLQLSLCARLRPTPRSRVECWIRWREAGDIDSRLVFEPPSQPGSSPLLPLHSSNSWSGGGGLGWRWTPRLMTIAEVQLDDRSVTGVLPLAVHHGPTVLAAISLSWQQNTSSQWSLGYAHGSLTRVEDYGQIPGAFDSRQRELRLSWIHALRGTS